MATVLPWAQLFLTTRCKLCHPLSLRSSVCKGSAPPSACTWPLHFPVNSQSDLSSLEFGLLITASQGFLEPLCRVYIESSDSDSQSSGTEQGLPHKPGALSTLSSDPYNAPEHATSYAFCASSLVSKVFEHFIYISKFCAQTHLHYPLSLTCLIYPVLLHVVPFSFLSDIPFSFLILGIGKVSFFLFLLKQSTFPMGYEIIDLFKNWLCFCWIFLRYIF